MGNNNLYNYPHKTISQSCRGDIFMLEEDDPAPPPNPPPSWTNDTLERAVDVGIDLPIPDGSPVREEEDMEKKTEKEGGWFSRILDKFSYKNLVDGQFEYGVPGLSQLFSAIQSFAYWGPNLVAIDALKSIFERS